MPVLGGSCVAATVVLAVFAVGLLACSLAGVPTVMPLLAGFILFFVYGLVRGHGWPEMARASWNGVRTAAKILITFMLIGVLTATWRASGTIVYIVNATSGLCSGSVIVLATFLLCSLVSFLTGTSFGTAATMGTICAFVATDAGVPLLVTGGAVLAGSYFGDRCSPVSTSALLVGTLTRTQVADNIPAMLRSSLVPFVLSCVAFFVMGELTCGDAAQAMVDASAAAGTVEKVEEAGATTAASSFASGFTLTPWALLPAILVLGLSLLRVDVWPVLAAGFLSAAVIACVCQGMQPSDMLWACVAGFSPAQGQSSLLSGGGIVSMLNVTAIVLVSSTYAGIFEKTGMLDGVRSGVEKVAARCGSFAATLLASIACALVCCNQSLTIMLSKQLCENAEPDQRRLALFLEDTAVVVAGLVPWSIAAAVPLAAVGAPSSGVLTACYLYLIPLWNLLVEAVRRRKARA
jgi:Na+:H+ antiporter, NhaC family